MLRGKKIVLVGDEKQVNPPASTDEFARIIKSSLGDDIPADTRDNLLPGRSIFDLFAAAYNGPGTTVQLREHFRCYFDMIELLKKLTIGTELLIPRVDLFRFSGRVL